MKQPMLEDWTSSFILYVRVGKHHNMLCQKVKQTYEFLANSTPNTDKIECIHAFNMPKFKLRTVDIDYALHICIVFPGKSD